MARKRTGHRAGMGGTIRVSSAADAGSSTQSRGVKSTVKSANSPSGKLPRSAVRVPKVNLANEYGISVQKANTKSAVSGPTTIAAGKKLPDNQSQLTSKVSRYTC